MIDTNLGLERDLRLGPVVVEASERREVLLGDGRRVLHHDEAVGVGRITHHNNLDVLAGHLVEDLALFGKDGRILANQILALHAILAREGTNEQDHVDIGESLSGIDGGNNALEQWIAAILQLHNNAVERLLRLRDLEHVEDHGLVGAEHLATRTKAGKFRLIIQRTNGY